MKCRYCGAELKEGAKFCIKCGKKIEPCEREKGNEAGSAAEAVTQQANRAVDFEAGREETAAIKASGAAVQQENIGNRQAASKAGQEESATRKPAAKVSEIGRKETAAQRVASDEKQTEAAEGKHCIHCGALLRQNAKFCIYCGQPVEQRAASDEKAKAAGGTVDLGGGRVSPSVAKSAQAVPHIEREQRKDKQPVPEAPASSGPRKGKRLAVLGGAAAVVVVLAALVLLLSGLGPKLVGQNSASPAEGVAADSGQDGVTADAGVTPEKAKGSEEQAEGQAAAGDEVASDAGAGETASTEGTGEGAAASGQTAVENQGTETAENQAAENRGAEAAESEGDDAAAAGTSGSAGETGGAAAAAQPVDKTYHNLDVPNAEPDRIIPVYVQENENGDCRVDLDLVQQYIPESTAINFAGVPNIPDGDSIDDYLRDSFSFAFMVGHGMQSGLERDSGSFNPHIDPDSTRYLLVFQWKEERPHLIGYFVGKPQESGDKTWLLSVTPCDYDFTELYEQEAAAYSVDKEANSLLANYIPQEEVAYTNAVYYIRGYNTGKSADMQQDDCQMYHIWSQLNSPYVEKFARAFSRFEYDKAKVSKGRWTCFVLLDENYDYMGYTVVEGMA